MASRFLLSVVFALATTSLACQDDSVTMTGASGTSGGGSPSDGPPCGQVSVSPGSGGGGAGGGGAPGLGTHFDPCGLIAPPSKSCSAPATATLTLGDQTFALQRGCVGSLDLEDEVANHFSGVALGLAPSDGCDPLLGIAVLDSVRYGDPPVDIDLDERLCNGSLLRNVGVSVKVDGACGVLSVGAAGTYHVESFDPDTGAMEGSMTGTLQLPDGGSTLPFQVEFAVGAGTGSIAEFFDAPGDVCAP